MCDDNAECNNTEGSYLCNCTVGYSGDGFNCTGLLIITMSNALFHEVYSLMADTDECFEGLDFCATHAECTNTIGSYECTCIVGYSGTGYSCGRLEYFCQAH